MPRVIHTAQALVDVVVEVAELPRRGSNAVATSYARYAGGAVNVLLAAARSGAAAVHAGAHGTGPNGEVVRAALAAEGVAISSPQVPGLDTGICFVMVEPGGERTFVTTQGPSATSPYPACRPRHRPAETWCASAATPWSG